MFVRMERKGLSVPDDYIILMNQFTISSNQFDLCNWINSDLKASALPAPEQELFTAKYCSIMLIEKVLQSAWGNYYFATV